MTMLGIGIPYHASHGVCKLNGLRSEKMINNRKGCTPWETKAARRIRTRVRNRRKGNRNKMQERS